MSNGLYATARALSLGAGLNLVSGNVKAALCTSAYTVNLTTDQFYSTVVASGGVVVTSGNFTTKTVTAGTFDADDLTYTAVATGSTVASIVIYVDTGTTTTSQLIAYLDTATGLPVVTNGGNIVLAFDNGTNRIFTI